VNFSEAIDIKETHGHFKWPMALGIKIHNDKIGEYCDFGKTGTVKERMRGELFSRAFVSGIIRYRIPDSHRSKLLPHSKHVGLQWYVLKERIPTINVVRMLVSLSIRGKAPIETIYGRSYTQLCRRPTYELCSRFGGAWSFPFLVGNRRSSLKTVLNSRKGRLVIGHLHNSCNKVAEHQYMQHTQKVVRIPEQDPKIEASSSFPIGGCGPR
jgi:hypothetical protein